MPRMNLRMAATMVALCMICLNPIKTYAENLNGPERDPIIVNEIIENISLTCPLPITISCDANGIYQTFAQFEAAGGSVALPDGCEESSIVLTWVADNVISQSGCNFVYMREYLLTADCDNTFTCNQIVMLNDTDDPFITNCPQDVALEISDTDVNCMVAYTVPTDVTATDGCSTATVSNDANPQGLYPIGTTTITYTAVDGCGNSSTCSFDIVVTDNSPLAMTCPPTITINDAATCDASGVTPYEGIAAFLTANGTIDGNCSTNGTAGLTLSSFDATTSMSCPNEVTRIYIVTDASNNTGSCTQIIEILDTTKPTFDAPADIIVDCAMTQDTSVTGSPENVADNCDTSPVITWFDKDSVQLSTNCSGEIAFTRSWIVTDNCMNADTIDQTITTTDTIAPEAICKTSFELFLDSNGDATFVADSLDNGSTDNCSDLTFTTDPVMTFVSCNQIASTIPVKLIATDGCGNSDTCDVTIMLMDTMSIILTSLPNDTVATINDVPDPFLDFNEYFLAGGNVNDNCLVNNTLNLLGADTTAICQVEIVRTYQYIDASGNSDTATHTIIVTDGADLADTEPPVITNVGPKFVALEHLTCTFDTTFTLPTATDDYQVDTTYFTISEFVSDTAKVTFFAQDVCGNISNTMFNLILFDPTSPDILIDDITIMCDTIGAAPIYATVQEFLTGQGSMVYDCRLDSASFVHIGDDTLPNGSIDRTYSIDDFTGNTGTEIQNITIIDATNPEFTFCPASFTVVSMNVDTCLEAVDIPTPEYNDNCNGTLILTHNSPYGIASDNADGDYPVGITVVSYFLEDPSGLRDTCTLTITVTDGVNPVISCPADTLVLCDFGAYNIATNVAELEQIGGSASDNCGVESITANIDTVSSINYNVTYTVSDTSGNQMACTQNVMIVDTIAPIFTCNADIEVNAPLDACEIQVNLTAPSAIDNCDSDLTITNSLTGDTDPSGIYGGTTVISWYAEDDFGNRDTCTYNIVVIDATSPVVVNPPDSTVMCEEMVAMIDTFITVADVIAGGGSITDNCGIEFFSLVSEVSNGLDTIVRTYEAIDSSNNSSTLTQTIIIDDTTPPTLLIPRDTIIDCSISPDSLSVTGTATMADDNCMMPGTPIYVDNVTTAACPYINQIERVWTLTDDSDNIVRDTQIILTIDTIGPIFDKAPDVLADIDCDADFPAFEVLTAQDSCSSFIITTDTIITPGTSCTGYNVTYEWTATDNCNNTTVSSIDFDVLPDNTIPVLVDINDQTLNTLPGTCGYPVDDVAKPIFTETCGDINYSSDFIFDTYPLDTTLVTWTVSSCGGDTTVVQTIVIVDNEPPVVVCQDLNISLGGDGFAIVQADTLAKTITDNCDHYFANSTKVRRVDGPSECTNDGGFNDSVIFCCDDIGKTIMVEVQVTDDSGNVNTCMSEIAVSNNAGIALVTGLPNIRITCEFLFDPSDLSIFGSYRDDENDVEDIIIDDHFYTGSNGVAGQDGYFINTCDLVTITETNTVNSGTCGNDTITRFFKFNNGTDSLTVQQSIIRSDVNPFTGDDIMWPANFVWNQCANPAPDTSIAGAPILINNDYCSQVAVSYKDQLFNFPLTSCPFVKRKWKVIDWCQYDNTVDPNPGLWTYSQFINVENDVAPTILSVFNDTLVCAPGNACDAAYSSSIAAEDDCDADAQNLYYQYKIDIYNDNVNGNDITGSTSSFEHSIPSGVHQVIWFVEDRCGNIAQEDFLITVKECKDPTPVCHNGLAIDLSGNTIVELWASDVNISSSDNCTATADLLLSFSSDVNDNLKTFTCADVGDQEVELWVTDEAGNQAFCTASISIQDNQNGCNNLNGNDIPLLGLIATENNIAIAEAMVSIQGAEMDDEYMTEENGMYSFENLDVQNDYQITVERDKDHNDGVTTLDLVLIQRHILGLESLNSPYKLIAADVNSSETLNSSDLLELRKLILGITEEFKDNTSWRFVSKNEAMYDMEDPWPFTEDLILSNNTSDIEADFVGVKIGDVNNSSEALISNTIKTRSNKTYGIFTEDQNIKRDDQVYVNFISTSTTNMEGLQMTLNWNVDAMNLIDIIPIGLPIEEIQINRDYASNGTITIAWHDIHGVKLSEGTPIFQMIMEGNTSGRLSDHIEITSDITSALMYDTNNEEFDVSLRFGETVSESIVMFQNKPNPFLSETEVEFTLPENMDVSFKIFNNSGKMIYENMSYYEKGRNSIIFSEELGDHSGILYLKMESSEFSEVKRMIRID